MPQTVLSNAEAVGVLAVLVLSLAVLWVAIWRLSRFVYRGAKAGLGRISRFSFAERYPLRAWAKQEWPTLYGWIAPRIDPREATGLPLTLLFCAAIYLLFLLGGLVEDVLEGDEVQTVDRLIDSLIAPLRHPWLIAVFLWITDLGSLPTLSAVAIVATGFLWAQGPQNYIPAIWLSVLGAQITTYSGKFVFARERPEFVLDISAWTHSFPSGHATGATAVYGIIAYAILRELDWPRGRFEIAFWSIVLITFIGFSRIFLGVHFASDVAAGFLVGGFWLLAGIALAEMTRQAVNSDAG